MKTFLDENVFYRPSPPGFDAIHVGGIAHKHTPPALAGFRKADIRPARLRMSVCFQNLPSASFLRQLLWRSVSERETRQPLSLTAYLPFSVAATSSFVPFEVETDSPYPWVMELMNSSFHNVFLVGIECVWSCKCSKSILLDPCESPSNSQHVWASCTQQVFSSTSRSSACGLCIVSPSVPSQTCILLLSRQIPSCPAVPLQKCSLVFFEQDVPDLSTFCRLCRKERQSRDVMASSLASSLLITHRKSQSRPRAS